MKQNSSSRRLGEQARLRIASILLTEVADPRLDLVTVTGAEVSTDRSLCKVYVTADRDRYDEVAEGLEAAKGRIRMLFGRGLGWRVTPELIFIIDTSVDQAERITEALKDVPPTLGIPKDEEGMPILPETSVEDGMDDTTEGAVGTSCIDWDAKDPGDGAAGEDAIGFGGAAPREVDGL